MGAIFNTLDTGRSAVDKLVTYATTNREKIFKTIVNALLLIIIFAVFGCFDFVNMRFDIGYLYRNDVVPLIDPKTGEQAFKVLKDGSTMLLWVSYNASGLWSGVITKAIAGAVCAYNLGINFVWDRDVEKNQLLRENAEKYENLLKLKDDVTFNNYVINVYNKEMKKRAYLNKINAKIWWLDKFSRNKDKLLYANQDEKYAEAKKTNKYCIKRAELEDLKSEEYIKENLDSIKVKYNAVNPLVFEMGLDGKPRKLSQTKTVGNTTIGRATKTSSGILSMIIVTAFIATITISPNKAQFESQMEAFWHYCLHIGTDIGVIAWQVLRGMFSSPKIVSEELVDPLIGRNAVLMGYTDYCAENKIEKSKGYLIYEKIENAIRGEIV